MNGIKLFVMPFIPVMTKSGPFIPELLLSVLLPSLKTQSKRTERHRERKGNRPKRLQ